MESELKKKKEVSRGQRVFKIMVSWMQFVLLRNKEHIVVSIGTVDGISVVYKFLKIQSVLLGQHCYIYQYDFKLLAVVYDKFLTTYT